MYYFAFSEPQAYQVNVTISGHLSRKSCVNFKIETDHIMLKSEYRDSQYLFTIVPIKFKCVSNTSQAVASGLSRAHRYAKGRSVQRTPEISRQ